MKYQQFLNYLKKKSEKRNAARLRGEVTAWEAENFPEDVRKPQPPPGWAGLLSLIPLDLLAAPASRKLPALQQKQPYSRLLLN